MIMFYRLKLGFQQARREGKQVSLLSERIGWLVD